MIKRVSSRQIYESRWTRLRVDEIEFADGTRGEYDIVERANAVLILAARKNHLLLVRQYRYPIEAWTWEFPAGACKAGEPVEAAARRELIEETGCIADQIDIFGPLYEVAGFAPHHFHIAEATVNEISAGPRLDLDEAGLSSQWFDIGTIKKMILRGEIQDGPSLAAFSIYLLRRADRI